MSLEFDRIYCIDCLNGLNRLDDNSIDAVVTDPPYELTNKHGARSPQYGEGGKKKYGEAVGGFMGMKWDATGISFNVDMWIEALRVLKPGGHLISFGGSRTYHRMACAIEDAGFEIRDQIMWVYGSGFPKSYDVAKGIESILTQGTASWNDFHKLQGEHGECKSQGANGLGKIHHEQGDRPEQYASHGSLKLEPTTPEAKEWSGWGTALKPAHEPIVLARKPLSEDTIAENVLKWGVGGLNIDGCRISHNEPIKTTNRKQRSAGWNPDNCGFDSTKNTQASASPLGRFPANFIHDGSIEVETIFSKAGVSKSSGGKSGHTGAYSGGYKEEYYGDMKPGFGDTGTPSRFFYCAKASKEERNIGVKHIEKTVGHNRFDKCAVCGGYMLQNPDRPSACKCEHPVRQDNIIKGNHHPTVKPIALMEYLVKLVTRDGQLVLDPFIGSGTTALACRRINRHFIGFEINQEYIEIANNRLANIPKRIETYGND